MTLLKAHVSRGLTIPKLLVLACISVGLSTAAPNASASAPAKVGNGLYHLATTSYIGTMPATTITATHDPGTVILATTVIDPVVMATSANGVTQAQACPKGGAATAVKIIATVALTKSSTANTTVTTAPPKALLAAIGTSDTTNTTGAMSTSSKTTIACTAAGMDNNTAELATCGTCQRVGTANTS